jgi:outer membrane protein
MKNRTMKKIFLSIIFIPFFGFVHAQEQLSLDRSIEIAVKNNFDIKIAQNQVLAANSNESQSRMNFLPTLNTGASYNMVHGSNFDQTHGSISQTTKSSSPYISSEVTLFHGLQNHYLLQRNRIMRDAALVNIESVRDQVEIMVVDLYLQVLMGMEEIKIIDTRLDLLNEQLVRATKRADAGVDNMQQVYNLNSQVANERLNQTRATNKLKQDRLRLLQALQLDISVEYDILPVNVHDEDIAVIPESYNEVLVQATDYSPDMKVAQMQWESEKKSLQIARSYQMPTLTLSGGISSNYSSNINSDYIDQIRNLRNEYLGLRLNIPIFNNFRVRNQIQLSEINISNAELNFKQKQMQLTNQVQQAYLDLMAAQSAYQAAKENLNALNQAFRFAESSYNSGNSDFYSYLESLNNKNRAELEIEISKYSFLLRKRILEIYTGRS